MTRVSGYVKRDGTQVKSYDRKTYSPKFRNKTPFIYNYNGKKFLITKSDRKNKQLMSLNLNTKGKVHFGDPKMREFPGTKREDNFCARTYGQKAKGKFTRNNPKSANFYNRRITWKCQGKNGVTK